MSYNRYKRKNDRFSLPDAEEKNALAQNDNDEKDWKLVYDESTDKEKAEVNKRLGGYDYVNTPEFKKLIANKDKPLFSVHVSTTGMNEEEDAIICIDIVNLKNNDAQRFPLRMTKPQYEKAINDKFDPFKYAGIVYGPECMTGSGAATAINEFLSSEMEGSGDHPVFICFQADFAKKFLTKSAPLFDMIMPDIDMCTVCKELNGQRVESNEAALFTGKTSMPNIAEQLGVLANTGLDKARLNGNILTKIKEEYPKEFLTADGKFFGIGNQPNFSDTDSYLGAIQEDLDKMNEHMRSAQNKVMENLFLSIRQNALQGELYRSTEATKQYIDEKNAEIRKDMADFVKISSTLFQAIEKISDAIDRQAEKIEENNKVITLLTQAMEKQPVMTAEIMEKKENIFTDVDLEGEERDV